MAVVGVAVLSIGMSIRQFRVCRSLERQGPGGLRQKKWPTAAGVGAQKQKGCDGGGPARSLFLIFLLHWSQGDFCRGCRPLVLRGFFQDFLRLDKEITSVWVFNAADVLGRRHDPPAIRPPPQQFERVALNPLSWCCLSIKEVSILRCRFFIDLIGSSPSSSGWNP